jgi:hypothetical protein
MQRKKQSNMLCVENYTTQSLRREGNMHIVCIARRIICVEDGFKSFLGEYRLFTGCECSENKQKVENMHT